MNLAYALQQIMAFTATLDPRMAVLLFVICAIGEFGISIPYVLESVWLLVGYQLGASMVSPLHLVGLWFAAQCGRQVGAMALYHVGGFGSTPLIRFYDKLRMTRFFSKVTVEAHAFNRINLSSPFSVGFGRLFGMRIPLTLILGAKKKLKTLSMGILIASIIWDTIYIAVGLTVGATAVVKPLYMFFYSLVGLTLIYLITFLVRRVIRHLKPANSSISHQPTLVIEDKNV